MDAFARKKTRPLQVGSLIMGGGNPIWIQSMTNTDTRDAEATVAQILKLEEAGCQIIRSAVFDEKAAAAVKEIIPRIHIPLVADVHFDYRLAVAAVENGVQKLRINPGNIGGRERVRFVADCCRAHHVPIRIGVNAGSLEKELKARFAGDTPGAMVESAQKHIALLEEAGFYDIALSLKCSSVPVTVEAYRRMSALCRYPLHVGVTETGSGQEGLAKSAVGIGTLLMEGIGDTIRVSLTGDPVEEVYAAKRILSACGLRREGVEVISCPTCGRTRVDLIRHAEYVKNRLKDCKGPLKVAVMGCAVNGPGEASDADMGIAFGQNNGVLFVKGKKLCAGPVEQMVEKLITLAREAGEKAQEN